MATKWSDDEIRLLEALKDGMVPSSITKVFQQLRKNRSLDSIRHALRTRLWDGDFEKGKIDWDRLSKGEAKVVRELVPTPSLPDATPGELEEYESIQQLVRILRSGPKNLRDVCDVMRMHPQAVEDLISRAIDDGYSLRLTSDLVQFTGLKPRTEPESICFPKPVHNLKFAVASDLHIGSKYARKEELRDFLRGSYEWGSRITLIPGDLLDGTHKMHRGMEYEQEAIGLTNQAKLLADTLPEFPDHRYYYITGNHDDSYHKDSGAEPGVVIQSVMADRGRRDMTYLGPYSAQIYLGSDKENEGLLIEMIHPDGGNPYALSYRPQKLVEALQSGTKPQIMLIGHLHSYVHIDTRSVDAFLCGCFQTQTTYLLRKGLTPVIAGLRFEVDLTENWSVRNLCPIKCKYYGSFAREISKGD